MVEVVHHLHQLGVMHRDIKPENFLLTTPGDDAVLKLCDFGLSAYWRAPLKPSVLSVFCCPGMACRTVRKIVLPAAVWWSDVRRQALRACLHTMVNSWRARLDCKCFLSRLLRQLHTALAQE